MTSLLPYKSTRYVFPEILVTGSGTVGQNFVTDGYIWEKGLNRVYYQNLNYSTTTSTTPVDVGSVVINPKFSGHIVIDNTMRINNELDKAGSTALLYVNSATLVVETYITTKATNTNEAALPFHYELENQPIGSTLVAGIKINTSGIGGTVIARMLGLTAVEI